MSKGLTFTAVFEAMSLNYGEGVGNISELKKLTKGGEIYSYLSRQAMRYDIFRMLKENFSIDSKGDPLTPENQVVQFKSDATIKDYVEMDLFGYMKTKRGENSVSRPAVVRISPALSLEPMFGDIEFGTNKNFADRVNSDPNPFQFEHHYSLYSYTVTIDLDRVGEDKNDSISLDNEEKITRVNQVLDVLKVLNRNIKGRTESLNPLFAIGGVYSVKNPFFLNRIKVQFDKIQKKYLLNTDILNSQLNFKFKGEDIREKTKVGYVEGYWLNEQEFANLTRQVGDIEWFFEQLKEIVKDAFKG